MMSPKDILTQLIHGLWGIMLGVVVISSYAHVVRSTEAPTSALAPVLRTKIFIKSDEFEESECVAFDVPKSGAAVLRLVNGAKIGARSQKRLKSAEIKLNGKKIVDNKILSDKTNVLNIPVKLHRGINRLCVKPLTKSAKRLAARINAPADKVVLTPVINPVVIGRDHLRVQATVTGLGVPVRHAKMRFEVSGLEPGPKARGATDRAGVATAFLSGFAKAGKGRLKAYVVGTDPLLSSEIPIQVVKAPTITLDHGVARLSVNKGDTAGVTIAVNVLQGRQQGYHVTLEHVTEPEPKGIVFKTDLPSGGVIGDKPQQVDIRGKVTGIAAGNYTLTTTATIAETNDKWSDTLTIAVVDPDAPDPLVLYAPLATPAGIIPGRKVSVTFRTSVAGARTPPDVLFLHEVDSAGRLKSPHVAELRDNGKDRDDHPGDLTYAGILNFGSEDEKIKTETTIDYRLRAEHFGKTVLSPIYTFHVTPLTVGFRPSDPSRLVKDPKSKFRLFSNEVVMGIHPDASVDSKRAEEIAGAVGGSVVGFWPPLRLYMVEIPVDTDADDLQKATNVRKAIEVISTFSEVRYAVPNYETLPLSPVFPDILPVDRAFPPNCDATTTIICQWYMENMAVLEAWRVAGGGETRKVAVIETDGKIDFGHPDLQGKGRQEDASGSTSHHATQVAGLIAAEANNAPGIGTGVGMQHGIAGVAYDSKLLAYISADSSQMAIDIGLAIAAGANIINISQESGEYEPLEEALNFAINGVFPSSDHNFACPQPLIDGKCPFRTLVVIAAGQPANQKCPPTGYTDVWPAKYNTHSTLRDGLIAVGATDKSDDLAQWEIGNIKWCSNDASWIDLYAPGKDIYSTIPGDSYAVGSGTSFAAALTSGAAAVLWNANNWSAAQVHDRLINTADKISGLGTCENGDICGRLNLFTAVVDVTGPPASPAGLQIFD